MNTENHQIIYILGPTAVGKTAVAMAFAEKIGGEIISADSMQVYRGLDIGTAKPSADERARVRHHLIDILEMQELCDVARFQKLAFAAIHNVLSRGRRVVVTGGSGMYVRVLTQGLLEGPGRDEALRRDLERLEDSELRGRLLAVDAKAATRIDVKDRRRMVRALEFHAMTGQPLSSQQKQWSGEASDGKIIFCLSRPREELYRRCDVRVKQMFDAGWVEEARGLMKRGLAETPTAAKAIGYREVMAHLRGEMDLASTIALVQQKTRNFVKRQLTWFRKEPHLTPVELAAEEGPEETATRLEKGI